ncbi:MAG: type II secretion system major pseudopilin GspG [Nitrospirae bacterium]|nr:type II secretion system major pseudopilin GspG [Nitrospirota bacterium]
MTAHSIHATGRPERRRPVLGQGGFTLIEIMVVIAILSILAVVVMPKLLGRTDDARITATKVQIKNIEEGLSLYKLDSGIFPSTEQGLDALVSKPTIGEIPRNWKAGGYLSKVPSDPWGNEYQYISPGSSAPYELMSYGADGEEGGEDVNADIHAHELG